MTRSSNSRTDDGPPGLDAAFELLSDRCRRYVLYELQAENGTASLDDVVDGVVERLSGDAADADRVLAQLHHTHLPKLTEAEVVELDEVEGTLRYREVQPVESALEYARKAER